MIAVPRSRRLLPLGLAAAATLALAGPAVAAEPETVATGLDNPRGLNFGPWGLYVAESGTGGEGPCITGGEDAEVCYGATGAVTVINRKYGQHRITTGLPSLAPAGGAEASGPSDVSFAKDDDGHDYDDRGFLTVGLGGDPAAREQLGEAGAGFAQLWRLWDDGDAHPVADLGAYEAANNPDEGQTEALPDSNPNSVAAVDGRHAYVADAGGNSILYVHKRTGEIDLVGVLPEGEAPAPEIPDFPVPPGTPLPFDAVPTSVAVGHDGEVYVGQLTGFPFPTGGAGVWVIRPGEDPVPYVTGFTLITDVAVGKDGSLYVVQLQDTTFIGPPNTGSVTRVHPDGTKEVVAEGLTAPYGIALKRGWAYVTTHATEPGTGEVVRFPIGDDGDDDHGHGHGHDHDDD